MVHVTVRALHVTEKQDSVRIISVSGAGPTLRIANNVSTITSTFLRVLIVFDIFFIVSKFLQINSTRNFMVPP